MKFSKNIRLATTSDASEIIEIYRPFVENTTVSFEADVPDASEMASRISKYLKKHCWLVYESKGKVVGYAYSSPHRDRDAYQWTLETSVYLSPDFRRKGIAEKLYKLILEISKRQGYFSALAGIGQPNPASVRFHEKMGFERMAVYTNVGYKLGNWVTNHWFERPLQEEWKTPGKILPMQEVDLSDLEV